MVRQRIGILALVAALLLSSGAVPAQGEFYIIGGKSSGGVGTKITGLPYTITTPGFYYLDRNLGFNDLYGDAITIEADNVTLDLMGFLLLNFRVDNSANGIYLNGRKNVEIRNGTVRGFFTGIYEASPDNGANHRILNIRADYNNIPGGVGIYLLGKNHLVRDCKASFNAHEGIIIGSGTITTCVASNNGSYGIIMGDGSLLENVATNNGAGFGLEATNNILVDGNSADGNSAANYSGSGPGTTWGVNAPIF